MEVTADANKILELMKLFTVNKIIVKNVDTRDMIYITFLKLP